MDITVTIDSQHKEHLLPGDSIDLNGDNGIIVYLTPEEAKAYRILKAERAKTTQNIIKFVEHRVRQEILGDGSKAP